MEALVFRYLAAAVGSLWAWAAIIAAALSVWRFRSAGPKPAAATAPCPVQPLQPPASPISSAAPCEMPPACSGDGGGALKGRFTTYFKAEELGGDVDGGGVGVTVKRRRREGLVVRRGDLGWYRYQDLSVINGSVVRLWDGDRRLAAATPAASGRRGRMGN